jgi:hypothetical protein
MSEIKVNKISPRAACGTVQLGDSGDTFTIPAGASITNSGTASGFGATGSASWNTTVKTSTFTAVAGEGYFVNTTGGAVTVNLPAGTAGAVVAVKDYANTFDTNNCILAPNGSDKIGGDNTADAILSTEGIAVTLVFIDSTKGWLVTDSGLQDEAPTAQFITATGGTITTVCTNFKVHTFTGPGTFTVCSVGNAAGSNTVDYLVVAGGGGAAFGGSGAGGGGGAGGFRASSGTASGSYTAGPGPLTSPVSALPVSAQGYPITVGGGGPGGPSSPPGNAGAGNNSIFSTVTSTGGGFGGGGNSPNVGGTGGSGGGGKTHPSTSCGGAGNTPPVSPPQGNNGGGGITDGSGSPNTYRGGGGGGATAVGTTVSPPAPTPGGAGGAGATSCITASPVNYAAGGGGGAGKEPSGQNVNGGAAGGPGAGAGGTRAVGNNAPNNQGGGGGGGGYDGSNNGGGNGGSGIVVIRYKFQ